MPFSPVACRRRVLGPKHKIDHWRPIISNQMIGFKIKMIDE
jgi:hypothetical protein